MADLRRDEDRMIATLFGKKKLSEEKFANVFVNSVLELVEQGFAEVVAELNESPEFERTPMLDTENDGRFTLIVIAGNLMEIPRQLSAGHDRRVGSLALSKFAHALGHSGTELEREVDRLQSLMSRLNYPSKRTVYAMGNALFHEYGLLDCQAAYFREMRVPNPIILKRVNTLMAYFLWDWQEFHENYRVSG
jgi:hypothetical protein